MEKDPKIYYFLFSKDFTRVIWLFYSKKRYHEKNFQKFYPLLDRSEIPFDLFSKNPDRTFRILNHLNKKLKQNK